MGFGSEVEDDEGYLGEQEEKNAEEKRMTLVMILH